MADAVFQTYAPEVPSPGNAVTIPENGQQGGGGFSAEATALFDRFTTPPTGARKTAIDDAIVALKAAGTWNKIDVLQVYGAADAQAAKLNWKGTSFTAVDVNAPTFTVDKGYPINEAAKVLNAVWSPATSVLGSQNSMSIGTFIYSLATTSSMSGCASDNVGGFTRSAWLDMNFTPNPSVSLNNAMTGAFGFGVVPAANTFPMETGLLSADRSASNVLDAYCQGILRGSTSHAFFDSTTPTTRPFYIGAMNANGSIGFGAGSGIIGAFFAGQSLLAADHLAISNALAAYFTAIGTYSQRAVAWGDSLSNFTWWRYAGRQASAGGRFGRHVFSQGVTGETTALIRVRMLADTTYHDAIQVIWTGRNDVDGSGISQGTILPLVADMVAAAQARSGKYLVVGLTHNNNSFGGTNENIGTTPGDSIIAYNAALLSAYGANYLNINALLVALGLTGDANDIIDANNGVPPRSKLADGAHMNTAGQTYVGQQIELKLEALGY